MLSKPQENELRALMARIIDVTVEKAGYSRNCLNCKFFTEATEHCGRWNKRPPARVLVNSCPAYEANPF